MRTTRNSNRCAMVVMTFSLIKNELAPIFQRDI